MSISDLKNCYPNNYSNLKAGIVWITLLEFSVGADNKCGELINKLAIISVVD